jgi:hypothetical protein
MKVLFHNARGRERLTTEVTEVSGGRGGLGEVRDDEPPRADFFLRQGKREIAVPGAENARKGWHKSQRYMEEGREGRIGAATQLKESQPVSGKVSVRGKTAG